MLFLSEADQKIFQRHPEESVHTAKAFLESKTIEFFS